MKVTELTYTLKKGQPNYGSVSAGMTVEVQDGENREEIWDMMKQEIEKQCTTDPSWINQKQTNEKGSE